MPELLLATVFLFIVWGFGLPLSRLLPGRLYPWRAFLAPAFGLAVAAIGVTSCYRAGLLPPRFLLIALAGAAVGFGFELWLARRLPGVRFFRLRTGQVVGFGFELWLARRFPGVRFLRPRAGQVFVGTVWLLATLLLIAPAWVGGDQFAVFQGNRYDTFGYLLGAIALDRMPFEAAIHTTPDSVARNPLVEYAAGGLAQRPAVQLLYASLASIEPGQMHRLHYAFLAVLSSLAIGPILFFLRVIAPAARWWTVLVGALAYPLGFWGQYALDLNAWSQVDSVPLFYALAAILVLGAALAPSLSIRDSWRLAAINGLLVAAGILVYPESFVLHVLAIFPAAALVLAFRARTFRGILRGLIPSLGLVGVAAGYVLPRTFLFAMGQIQFATRADPVVWWHFFQGFLAGRDGWNTTLAANVSDFVASALGLYFVTPGNLPAHPGGEASLHRLLLLAVSIALVVGALGTVRRRSLGSAGTASAAGLLLVAGAILAAGSWFALHDHNYWVAGKALSYASPFFVSLLVLPVVARKTSLIRHALAGLAVVFAVWQAGLGVYRLKAAHAEPGRHYSPPYPIHSDFKVYCWDLRKLERAIAGAQGVELARMNSWSQAFLIGWLTVKNLHFSTRSSYISFLGSGEDHGSVPPNGPIDWALDVVGKDFVIRHIPSGTVSTVGCGDSP